MKASCELTQDMKPRRLNTPRLLSTPVSSCSLGIAAAAVGWPLSLQIQQVDSGFAITKGAVSFGATQYRW